MSFAVELRNPGGGFAVALASPVAESTRFKIFAAGEFRPARVWTGTEWRMGQVWNGSGWV